jgi:hypothetical protein
MVLKPGPRATQPGRLRPGCSRTPRRSSVRHFSVSASSPWRRRALAIPSAPPSVLTEGSGVAAPDFGPGRIDEANSRSHSYSRLHRRGAGSSRVWGHPCGTESGQSERDRQPDAVLSRRRGCWRPGTRPRQLLARISVQRALGDERWWQRGHALRRERKFHCGQDDKWCGSYDKWRLSGSPVRRCLLPPTSEVDQRNRGSPRLDRLAIEPAPPS